MIPTTAHISFERWTGAVVQEYQTSASSVPHYHGGPWQDWAKKVALVPEFAVRPLPRPEQFTTWQEWANIFRLVLET